MIALSTDFVLLKSSQSLRVGEGLLVSVVTIG
jgi:hypothetical protein